MDAVRPTQKRRQLPYFEAVQPCVIERSFLHQPDVSVDPGLELEGDCERHIRSYAVSSCIVTLRVPERLERQLEAAAQRDGNPCLQPSGACSALASAPSRKRRLIAGETTTIDRFTPFEEVPSGRLGPARLGEGRCR